MLLVVGCRLFRYVVVIVGILQICAGAASALVTNTVVTPDLEQISITSVNASFQTITFGQTYTNPIPVCVGQVGSSASWTPVVRITGLTGTGMQVRVQKFSNLENDTSNPPVFVGTVHCIIADAGSYAYPGATSSGIWFQAGSLSVTKTHGSGAAADDWSGFGPPLAVNAGLNGAYAGTPLGTNLAVVAQTMTSNDGRGQAVHVNDCDQR